MINDNWIMVKDRLPEKSVSVIIRTAYGRIYKGMYCISHGTNCWYAEQPYWAEIEDVVAWIPLPTMPRVYVWARLGAEIDISLEEAGVVFGSDKKASAQLLQQKVNEGKFKITGDSYIPDMSMMEFDERYGTDYASKNNDGDVNFEIDEVDEEKEKAKYTANYLADIDVAVEADSPEQAKEIAQQRLGEYVNCQFKYAYLSEVNYVEDENGIQA